jgi:LEA14-like dessication related protein
MTRLTLRALVLATLLALAACATFGPKLETPTVSVVALQMTSGDMFSQRFRVRVKVQNPNDLEVPVESIEYTMFLMGDRFGKGTTDQPFVLPARGEAEFDMMLTTDFVSALGRLVSRMGGGKLENVEYEVNGKLHLDKGFVRTIPFDRKGLVNVAKPPKQAAQDPAPNN